MVHGRAVLSRTALATFMIWRFALGCAHERSVTPQSQSDALLYVGTSGPDSRVYVYDLANDSLVDSSQFTNPDMTTRLFSNGEYFVRFAGWGPCGEIWKAKTMQLVALIPGCIGAPMPVASDAAIALIHARTVTYLDIPTLSAIGTDTLLQDSSSSLSVRDADESRALLFLCVLEGVGHTIRTDLLVWDYRRRELFRRWNLEQLASLHSPFIRSLQVFRGEASMIAVVNAEAGSVILKMNFESGAIEWTHPIAGTLAQVAITPDQNEVWRYYHAAGHIDGASPDLIYVHDASTGQLFDSVPLPRLFSERPISYSIQDVAFSTDGARAYLAAGDVSHGPGPVFIVAVQARRIVDSVLTGRIQYPYTVDVTPLSPSREE